MAGALGERLAERGYTIAAVLSRRRAQADRLAGRLGAIRASEDLAALPEDVRLVLICVSDAAVAAVARSLAAASHPWHLTAVAHTSGGLSAAALAPLSARGAAVLSFHPLQTLTRSGSSRALEEAFVGIEGDEQGVAVGVELARELGMRPLVMSAASKPLYHAAASMASNFLVTLVHLAQQVLEAAIPDVSDASEVLLPLLRGTLANVTESGTVDALTGPILRGDVETVRRHCAALENHLPHLLPVYAVLGIETVRLAAESGRLDPNRASELRSLLEPLVSVVPARRRESGELLG